MSKKRIAYLKIIFTLAVFGALIYVVGWQEIFDALRRTNMIIWLFVVLIVIIWRLFEAFQMKLILSKAGMDVRTKRIFLANSLSTLYSFILPGDLIASGAKWANLSAYTGKKSGVLNSIIYHRFMLLLLMSIIGTIAVFLHDPLPHTYLREIIFIFTIGLVVGGFIVYHPRLGSARDNFLLKRAGKRLPLMMRERVEMFLTSLQSFRQFGVKFHLCILAFSLLIITVQIFNFILVCYSVGIVVPIVLLIWLRALTTITRQLPLTINNLGIREGILILILTPYGIPMSEVMALGLIMVGNVVLFALVGLGYQLALSTGLAHWKPVVVDDQARIVLPEDDDSK